MEKLVELQMWPLVCQHVQQIIRIYLRQRMKKKLILYGRNIRLKIRSGQILFEQIHRHFIGTRSYCLYIYGTYHMVYSFSRKRESPSRKEFLTQQRSAVPESDHKTFCSDVGMTEFGTLKNGIQWGWILFYDIRVPCILAGSLNQKKININDHKHPI